jgi:hypothetical protein
MKNSILALVVALAACGGGGSDAPDLSNWAQEVAASIKIDRNNIIYYNVKATENSICGKAVNVYNASDFSYFFYDGTKVTWGTVAYNWCYG